MSPLTNDEHTPCPLLIEKNGIKICSDYEHRPERCKNHELPAKFCPIGCDVLRLNREEAARRVQRNDWILYGE